MLEKTNIELAKVYKSKSKTAFIYVYGVPQKIKGTTSYIINAASLDMCLIEYVCSSKHLFPRHIYDLEENKHFLSQPYLA
jgi:squalene cyclase